VHDETDGEQRNRQEISRIGYRAGRNGKVADENKGE
jgi:hypothetical protein